MRQDVAPSTIIEVNAHFFCVSFQTHRLTRVPATINIFRPTRAVVPKTHNKSLTFCKYSEPIHRIPIIIIRKVAISKREFCDIFHGQAPVSLLHIQYRRNGERCKRKVTSKGATGCRTLIRYPWHSPCYGGCGPSCPYCCG